MLINQTTLGKLPHRSGSITTSLLKYVFHISVVNAFAFWKVKTKNKDLCFRSFREKLVLLYLEKTQNPPKNKKRVICFVEERHKYVTGSQNNRGRCVVCKKVTTGLCSCSKHSYIHSKCLQKHIDQIKTDQANKRIKNKTNNL